MMIKDLKGLVGKTIVTTKQNGGELWLKFSNGDYSIIINNDITHGFGYPEYEIDLDKYDRDNTNKTLVELGLITKEQYSNACIEGELECERREKERKKKEYDRIKSYELEQLKKLTLKYN